MFGFHRRKRAVELILTNGHVYTQDPDQEWTEAVVCGEGAIIYTGSSEEAEEMATDETLVIDLDGKYVFPGFINLYAHPGRRLFDGRFLKLYPVQDKDDVIEAVSDYIKEEDKAGYFAYGFSKEILDDMEPEERRTMLDGMSDDKPVVLLAGNAPIVVMNTCAIEQVRASASEAGVERIDMNFILQSLELFDYEELQQGAWELAEKYGEKGFTAVVDAGTPDFMDEYYQDSILTMFHENKLMQRHFGGISVEADADPKQASRLLMYKKVQTTELEGMILCDLMKIVVDFGIDNEEKLDKLIGLVGKASENGFRVYLEARNKAAFEACVETVDAVRGQGSKKNRIIISADSAYLENEAIIDDMQRQGCSIIAPLSIDDSEEFSALENAARVGDVINRYTDDAAIALGIYDSYGSIQAGKKPDFTVFAENPLEMTISQFRKMNCEMTIIDGKIAYDIEEEVNMEWLDVMESMHI